MLLRISFLNLLLVFELNGFVRALTSAELEKQAHLAHFDEIERATLLRINHEQKLTNSMEEKIELAVSRHLNLL